MVEKEEKKSVASDEKKIVKVANLLEKAAEEKKAGIKAEVEAASKPLIIVSPIKQSDDEAGKQVALDSLDASISALNAATERLKKAPKTMSEVQLKNPFLHTDFDRVLGVVENEGVIKAARVREMLGMDSVKLKDCYKVLEEAGKIRVDYPLFGQPKLISVAFEKAKKRKELASKGIEFEDDEETK